MMPINASTSLLTPPTLAVLTLAEAKLHLRVENSAEDTLITALVAAATQDAEHLMQRAILPQQWRHTMDAWPQLEVRLPRPLITAVDSISYTDSAGAVQALAPASCILAATDLGARLQPAYGTWWPSARYQPGAIVITYTAGWPTAEAVPELVRAWIKLRLGALYDNRNAWTQGVAIERNGHIDFLLDRWRVFAL